MNDVYDGTTTTPVSAASWLSDLFLYEYCAECGGDAEHHTVVSLLGNPSARCDYPPTITADDAVWHPTIAAFRVEQYQREG